jgi:hypothetical protein
MNLNGKHDFYHGWRFRHRARLKEYESGPTEWITLSQGAFLIHP